MSIIDDVEIVYFVNTFSQIISLYENNNYY